MPRVKIHENQLTLPDELRQALSSANEDELDAELVEGGVLLRPSSAARRKAAREAIRAIQQRVRRAPELDAMSPEEEEEMIAELLAADKAEAAGKRKHG